MMQSLGARGINELHVEAGHKLNASLLRAGLVDELLQAQAARIEGRRLKVEQTIAPDLLLIGEPFLLRQALANFELVEGHERSP